jgi:hypothetical protein
MQSSSLPQSQLAGTAALGPALTAGTWTPSRRWLRLFRCRTRRDGAQANADWSAWPQRDCRLQPQALTGKQLELEALADQREQERGLREREVVSDADW